MSLLDNVRAKLGPAKDKVSDLAQRHEGTIQHGLDKAARAVDKRTKGKYSDRIQSGTGRAKSAVDRLTHKDDGAPNAGGTRTPSGASGTTPPPATGGAPPPEAPSPEAPPPTS
ncbi:antitoxin [Streptomyces sp. NPDC092370]|uniref:antitoxin n=1 Tax=Streptomyces sp. NPDC092370 TaxID=3366016 RepID=UPI0037F924C4